MEKDKINPPIQAIAIGGSSGSLDAVLKILSGLDEAFYIPILVVMHRNPQAGDILAGILASKTKSIVKEADEKEPIVKNYIYLAPPDYHLLVENDFSLSLDASEKIHYSRPSIDVTFQSAADVYETGLVCILLSGANHDGSDGVAYAKQKGAKIIIQDPADAIVPYMPQHAITQVACDGILYTAGIATYLNKLNK